MSAWNLNASFDRSGSAGKAPFSRAGLIFVCVFLTPFFLVGGTFLILGLIKVAQGAPAEGWPLAGFALVFLTMASGFLALIVHAYRRSGRQARVAAAHPDAPWLRRKDWAEGRARSNRRASLVALWAFTLFWNAVSSPILFVLRREWENGNKAVLVGLLFPLIGIGLLVAAVRMTLQWRRFGQSVVHLETLPGRLGRHLQARLVIPVSIVTIQEIGLRLACIRRTTTGSGKNRTTRETLLWEEKRAVPHRLIEPTDQGLRVPVFFPLPADPPETLDGNPAIVWKLEAKADLPGVDYAESFEVPVFRSHDEPPAEKVADPLAVHQTGPAIGTVPNLKGVRIRETATGVSIDFLPGRNKRNILALIGFAAVWTGIFAIVLASGPPLLFALIWGFVDLLLIAGIVSALFYGVRVTTHDGLLTIRHRVIAPTVTRTLPAGSVRRVTATPGTQSGTNPAYRILVEDQSGRRFHAGGGIPEKRDAVWIAERLAIAVGL